MTHWLPSTRYTATEPPDDDPLFVQARRMAVMSVSSTDWADVRHLAAARPQHIIPAFGIHPWKAHLHASSSCEATTVADTLDQSKLDSEQQAALPPEAQHPLIQVLLCSLSLSLQVRILSRHLFLALSCT